MLLTLHIVAASAWLGLVAGEVVIELTAKDRVTRKFVARAHEIMDLYFEGPLVVATLVTGSFLLYGLWPNVSTLLMVKILAAFVAIVSNVLCIRWVVLREKARTDEDFLKWAQKISTTGYTIPFGVAALLIGLVGA
jgi:hypothetical protein